MKYWNVCARSMGRRDCFMRSAKMHPAKVKGPMLKRGGPGASDVRSAAALLAPFMLFFILFVLYPVIKNIYYAFTNYNLTSAPRWIGLRNFERLARDTVFRKALGNTALYAAVSVAGLAALGLAAALALNGGARWLSGVRLLCLYPYATSMTAVSMVWLLMFDPLTGYANKLLSLVGSPGQAWLFSRDLALPCLIFVNIWKNIGYCMLVFLTGLQTIDPALYEAALVDGANAWQRLRSVTLPALSPILLFVLVTTTTESFKTFEHVQIMTRGDPLYATTTIVHQIYLRGFGEYKMGYAAAMSVALLLILTAVTALQFAAAPKGTQG